MYENYAKIRDSRGLRDSDVSRGTGISSSVFSDWKKGRYDLKYDKLQKIAEFLGVTTDQLAGVQQDEQPGGYYISNEAAEITQAMLERPGLRTLMDASRKIGDDDLQLLIDMATRFKETNPDG